MAAGRRLGEPSRRSSRVAALVLLAGAALALVLAVRHEGSGIPQRGERDVRSWAPPDARPLPDARAAALITRTPENRPANAPANDYVPSERQLAAFEARARTAANANPLAAYVTGRPGIHRPSTDDLIQWVSHKWGIPTDWIRAQVEVESQWRQDALGDRATVAAGTLRRYPRLARAAGGSAAYESLGIAQVKWAPNGSVGAGTEPLRWESTAFDLDYYAATLRYYYDGYCGWCSAGYRPGQSWRSIGAWFSPEPWANASARDYVDAVRVALAEQSWTDSGF